MLAAILEPLATYLRALIHEPPWRPRVRSLPRAGSDAHSKTTRLPVEGDVIGGKYRVIREIGRGGMSAVYEAHHVELDEVVALKLLLPELARDRNVSQLFAREARAAAKVRSPHVAHVYDVGQLTDGLPYIVMERLHGFDLSEVLAEQGPLDLRTTIELMLQLADGLEHAHARGIVHHDLKPSNLFVALDRPSRPTLKLIDFGISTLMAVGAQPVNEPSPQQICGSPEYMSPERLSRAFAADSRSDIWALGVILVECLTGDVPFKGAALGDVCSAILDGEPDLRALEQLGLPASIHELVRACLRRDVSQRIQSVTEWAQFLSSIRAEINGDARTSTPPVVVPQPTPVVLEPIPAKPKLVGYGRALAPRVWFVAVSFCAGFLVWYSRVVPIASSRGVHSAQPSTQLAMQPALRPRAGELLARAPPEPTMAPETPKPVASDRSSTVRGSKPRPHARLTLRPLRDDELFNEPR